MCCQIGQDCSLILAAVPICWYLDLELSGLLPAIDDWSVIIGRLVHVSKVACSAGKPCLTSSSSSIPAGCQMANSIVKVCETDQIRSIIRRTPQSYTWVPEVRTCSLALRPRMIYLLLTESFEKGVFAHSDCRHCGVWCGLSE